MLSYTDHAKDLDFYIPFRSLVKTLDRKKKMIKTASMCGMVERVLFRIL